MNFPPLALVKLNNYSQPRPRPESGPSSGRGSGRGRGFGRLIQPKKGQSEPAGALTGRGLQTVQIVVLKVGLVLNLSAVIHPNGGKGFHRQAVFLSQFFSMTFFRIVRNHNQGFAVVTVLHIRN